MPARVNQARIRSNLMQAAYDAAKTVSYPAASLEAQAAAKDARAALAKARAYAVLARAGLPDAAAELDEDLLALSGIEARIARIVDDGLHGQTAAADAELKGLDGEVQKLSSSLIAMNKAGLERAALRARALSGAAVASSAWLLGAGVAGVMAALAGALWLSAVGLVRPLTQLREAMARLAEGRLDTEVAGEARGDEIGAMARAVQVFKDNALRTRKLEREAEQARDASEADRAQAEAARAEAARQLEKVVQALACGLSRLSRGELDHRLTTPFPAAYERLRADFNAATAHLQEALQVIAGNAESMREGAGEIAQAANDLSRRTEQQAASLEETAAALDQITATVRRTAEGAKEIKALISASAQQVDAGLGLVAETGQVLERILAQVSQINGLVAEISASAQEQATGLQQVNTAVNQMDQVTQQNAAMVEQSTSASRTLAAEAEALARLVGRFQLGDASEGRPPPRSRSGPPLRRAWPSSRCARC